MADSLCVNVLGIKNYSRSGTCIVLIDGIEVQKRNIEQSFSFVINSKCSLGFRVDHIGSVSIDIDQIPKDKLVYLPLSSTSKQEILSSLILNTEKPSLVIQITQFQTTILTEDCEAVPEDSFFREHEKLRSDFQLFKQSAQKKESKLIQNLQDKDCEINDLKSQLLTQQSENRSLRTENAYLADNLSALQESDMPGQLSKLSEELQKYKKLLWDSEESRSKLRLQLEGQMSDKIEELKEEIYSLTALLKLKDQELAQREEPSIQNYINKSGLNSKLTQKFENVYSYGKQDLSLFWAGSELTVQMGRQFVPLTDFLNTPDIQLALDESYIFNSADSENFILSENSRRKRIDKRKRNKSYLSRAFC